MACLALTWCEIHGSLAGFLCFNSTITASFNSFLALLSDRYWEENPLRGSFNIKFTWQQLHFRFLIWILLSLFLLKKLKHQTSKISHQFPLYVCPCCCYFFFFLETGSFSHGFCWKLMGSLCPFLNFSMYLWFTIDLYFFWNSCHQLMLYTSFQINTIISQLKGWG